LAATAGQARQWGPTFIFAVPTAVLFDHFLFFQLIFYIDSLCNMPMGVAFYVLNKIT